MGTLQNKHYCNPFKTRFLSTQEIINEAVFCPCLLFCGAVVPIVPTGTPTPIPPLPPPVPPVPPGRVVIGTGMFTIANTGAQVGPNVTYTMNLNGTIEGVGMTHINGTNIINLIPNTTYEFSYSVTITAANMSIPNTVRSYLALFSQGFTRIGEEIRNDLNGTITLTASGTFTTSSYPTQNLELRLGNTSTGLTFIADSGTLLLEALG